MRVSKNTVVAFDYVLTDSEGQLIDSSADDQPLSYLHGYGMLIPGMEQALNEHGEGDSFTVTIPSEEAYGDYDDELLLELSHDNFEEAETLATGDHLILETEDEGDLEVTVVEVQETGIVVDGNHPLAGKTLNFQVKIQTIRKATKEEIEHGHVHDGTEDH
ncbi:MAG: FKBP-type peptidyl-prolyl cis-trans isomerase [Pirellulales bacterium]